MVFEKYNGELKVRFTRKDKYGYQFSSAQEAFTAIDTDLNHSHSGTVTQINNQEHSITIELNTYDKQDKWKLYYADSNYTGLVCLSSSNTYDFPIPALPGTYFTLFARHKK